jgi:hypothetical protein
MIVFAARRIFGTFSSFPSMERCLMLRFLAILPGKRNRRCNTLLDRVLRE